MGVLFAMMFRFISNVNIIWNQIFPWTLLKWLYLHDFKILISFYFSRARFWGLNSQNYIPYITIFKYSPTSML
jgi:hypothetical protein